MRSLLLLVPLLLLSGCGPSTARSWDGMHSAACSGDAIGFLSYWDREAFEAAARRKVRKHIRRQADDKATAEFAERLASPKVKDVVEDAFDDWRKDIEREKGESDWCQTTLRKAGEEWVRIETKNGTKRRIRMQKGKRKALGVIEVETMMAVEVDDDS